jgi:hypothetical protein
VSHPQAVANEADALHCKPSVQDDLVQHLIGVSSHSSSCLLASAVGG